MSYWHCKNGEITEVSASEANYLRANGERVTNDPFEAATYLADHDY